MGTVDVHSPRRQEKGGGSALVTLNCAVSLNYLASLLRKW